MHSSRFVRRGARECLAVLALGAFAVPALALAAPGGGTTSSSIPIEFELYDVCTGEFVLIAGTIHSVSNLEAQGADGSHIVVHQNFSGVTGVGESSGDAYTITGSASQKMGGDASRLLVHENFVSRGSAGNESIGMMVQVTIGPNGEVTTVERSSDECRG